MKIIRIITGIIVIGLCLTGCSRKTDQDVTAGEKEVLEKRLTVQTVQDTAFMPEDMAHIIEKGYLVFGFIEEDRPPFYMTGEQGEFYGLDVELARSMAKELGVEAVMDRTSETYQELYEKVIAGEVDMAVAKFSRTLKRATCVSFTHPYVEFGRAIMMNKAEETRLGITGAPIAYLKQNHIKIAVLASTSFVEYAREMFPQGEIMEYHSVEEAVEAVLNGEATVFLYDELEFARFVSKQKDLLIYTSVYVLEDMREYLCGAVSPRNPHLREWVNVFIDNRDVNRTLTDILKAYPEVFSEKGEKEL